MPTINSTALPNVAFSKPPDKKAIIENLYSRCSRRNGPSVGPTRIASSSVPKASNLASGMMALEETRLIMDNDKKASNFWMAHKKDITDDNDRKITMNLVKL